MAVFLTSAKGNKSSMHRYLFMIVILAFQPLNADESSACVGFDSNACTTEELVRLGWIYGQGLEGMSKDFEKSFMYFKQAADQGHIDAQYKVGHMYLYALGTEQNVDKAVEYYMKASGKGHTYAHLGLALMFYKGIYTNPDIHKSIHYYELAAHQGDSGAQNTLGNIYRNGKDIESDLVLAKFWYKRACSHDNQSACRKYKELDR